MGFRIKQNRAAGDCQFVAIANMFVDLMEPSVFRPELGQSLNALIASSGDGNTFTNERPHWIKALRRAVATGLRNPTPQIAAAVRLMVRLHAQKTGDDDDASTQFTSIHFLKTNAPRAGNESGVQAVQKWIETDEGLNVAIQLLADAYESTQRPIWGDKLSLLILNDTVFLPYSVFLITVDAGRLCKPRVVPSQHEHPRHSASVPDAVAFLQKNGDHFDTVIGSFDNKESAFYNFSSNSADFVEMDMRRRESPANSSPAPSEREYKYQSRSQLIGSCERSMAIANEVMEEADITVRAVFDILDSAVRLVPPPAPTVAAASTDGAAEYPVGPPTEPTEHVAETMEHEGGSRSLPWTAMLSMTTVTFVASFASSLVR